MAQYDASRVAVHAVLQVLAWLATRRDWFRAGTYMSDRGESVTTITRAT